MTTRAAPATLEAPELTLIDSTERCEDCPDVNFDPPANSDCQYFRRENGVAVCDRSDSFEKQFSRVIGSTGTDGLVQVIEYYPTDINETTG